MFRRLRSVRTKLALVFFAIIASAFGLLYFIATPQLQSRLEQRQLDDIRASAQAQQKRFANDLGRHLEQKQLDEEVRGISEATDARVTLLDVRKHGLLIPTSDSRLEKAAPFDSGLARAAVRSEHPRTKIDELAGERLAQVAQPFFAAGKHKHAVAVAFYARDLNLSLIHI